MMYARFHNPPPISRDEMIKAFTSVIKIEICDTLVAMAFYGEDWKWAQNQCLFF